MAQQSRAKRIERQIAQETGAHVVVAESNGALLLSGAVPTGEDRARAAAIVASLAGGLRIENGLEVRRLVAEGREDTASLNAGALNPDEIRESPPPILSSELDAGTNQVPLETDAGAVVDPTVADAVDPVEEDPAYFAPTDPVITEGRGGDIEVLGGWEPTSDSSDAVPASAEDNQPGDEALAEAITRELREDAATTTLRIDVQVDRGVAHLRGRVADLTDAENAEYVASRVPGVRDVVEELDVASM
ncbi:MAG TPA: BON domain-containing protein [Ktedonobacterales bacterium]|nr:BON domain-containing protein [Ktedonobacterales bacterium]